MTLALFLFEICSNKFCWVRGFGVLDCCCIGFCRNLERTVGIIILTFKIS